MAVFVESTILQLKKERGSDQYITGSLTAWVETNSSLAFSLLLLGSQQGPAVCPHKDWSWVNTKD